MAKTLKNESLRKFTFGPGKDDVFAPNEVSKFDDATAASLLKHKGVIDVNNIKITYDQTKVKDNAGDEEEAEAKTDAKPVTAKPASFFKRGSKQAEKEVESEDDGLTDEEKEIMSQLKSEAGKPPKAA